MHTPRDNEQVQSWLIRPLCCKYAAVVFREASFHCDSDAPPRTFTWGLGRLADGECEILGAWMTSGEDAAVSDHVFADLADRGVQSFKVLAGCSAAEEVAAQFFDKASAGAIGHPAIPLQGQLLRESAPVLALRPATRKAVRAADRTVDEIDSRLRSALARHAAFSSEADAIRFIAEFLVRADRKLAELPVRRSVAAFGLASSSRSLPRA